MDLLRNENNMATFGYMKESHNLKEQPRALSGRGDAASERRGGNSKVFNHF